MTNKDDNTYYFVSLGRERGGLLDVLGLRQNASEVDVGNKVAEYRKRARDEVKRERIALNKRLDLGEITKEELETKMAEIKEQMEAKLTKLNELEAKFDKLMAERRLRKRAGGQSHDESGWAEIPAGLPSAEACLGGMLAAPLPRLADDALARVSGGALAESKGDEATLADVRWMVFERRLLALLQADRLWDRVQNTNRARWTTEVQAALGGVEGPRLRSLATQPVPEPMFPSLCRSTKREVVNLRAENIEDHNTGPQRRQSTPKPPDFRDLMAALARQATSGGGPEPGAGMNFEMFRELMATVMAGRGEDERG